MRTNITFFLLLALLVSSCATYNTQVRQYYDNLRQGDFDKASRALDRNRLLKKDRNHLLYLLERGKLCYMMQQWDSSNRYFNEADAMMEGARNSAGDVIAGTLINPMMKRYRAEDFETYLVHYYKALNYLQLGNNEDAMVEARRISLTSDAQADKSRSSKRYSDDAFANIMQGLIYEAGRDYNNAFISYRNAADIYLAHNGTYYETQMPLQLQKDLLKTAHIMGFYDEEERYTRLFGGQPSDAGRTSRTVVGSAATSDGSTAVSGGSTAASRSSAISSTGSLTGEGSKAPGGELVLFWENGSAPVKVQEDLFFAAVKGAGGAVLFSDGTGRYNNIPFVGRYDGNTDITDLRSLRVAIPRYEAQPLRYTSALLRSGNNSYPMEEADNINALAFATLRERMVKELATTLTRLAVKKLAEAAVRGGKSSDDANKTAEEKKKAKKEENTREALALGLQLINFATEKADTRNWQSLPHSIYYVRIPLNAGVNNLTVELSGDRSASIPLQVYGNGQLQIRSISTLGAATVAQSASQKAF